jgi:perosamine synthetase
MPSNETVTSIPTKTYPLSEPSFGEREADYLQECIRSGWVSSVGPFVTRFEQAIADYVGVRHAIALVNGTAALHLALQIAGLRADEEVLVSSLSFVAPANAVRYHGAHPIFVDADSETWQMDVHKLEHFLKTETEQRDGGCFNRKTGRRVRAIVPVHIMGLACDIDRIVELGKAYQLRVIEDAAEGLGVLYKNRHVGTFGDMGVLSFNGNKIITTGGGGMLLTSHDPDATKARYLSTQAKDDELEYDHGEVGYNYRLTNVQSAIGLAQLERLPSMIERKRTIAARYQEAFADLPVKIHPMPTPALARATYWLYTILLPQGTSLERRKDFIRRLRAVGVLARPFWKPLHQLRPYVQSQAWDVTVTPDLYTRGVSLPSSAGLTDADQQDCIRLIRTVISEWSRNA